MRQNIISERIKNWQLKSDQAFLLATKTTRGDINNSVAMPVVSNSPLIRARPLRYSRTYQICQPVQEIMVTGLTPTNKKCKEKEANKRRKLCERPFLVKRCEENGKIKRGKQCDICQRQTIYWCLGCHRHFCNDVPDYGSNVMVLVRN